MRSQANWRPTAGRLLERVADLRQKADKATSLLVAIVDSTEDGIVSTDLEGTITTWNKGAEKVFGFAAAEAVGQNVSLMIPFGRREESAAILGRIRRGEGISHLDTVRARKGGAEIDVALTVSPIRNATGKTIGASKIARDISRREHPEEILRESEERFRTLADALDVQVQFRTQELQRRNAEMLKQSQQLQDLSQRLLQSQDEERRHIARELHDSAGQTLAALAMNLSRVRREAEAIPAFNKCLEDAAELVAQLVKDIRTTSYLLHPPLLEESGLSSALAWYVEGLAQRSELEIDLKMPGNFGRLPREMELIIFRVVQESLTNSHRHSGSKTATIRLGREANSVFVEIQDRGKGISQERLAEVESRSVGVGIPGMRERFRPFQGELTIDSNALGTKIRATLSARVLRASENEQQAMGRAASAD